MRKLYHFLVVTVFLLCLVPQTCLAIMYANGDANYPIWNTGNRGGSAFDLSSCVITRDTDSELIICAFNYHRLQQVLSFDGSYLHKADSLTLKNRKSPVVSANLLRHPFAFQNMHFLFCLLLLYVPYIK